MPALTGDCTTSAGAVATTCTKINGVDQTTARMTYTPTITCGTGALTSGSATGAYKTLGKTVSITVQLPITTIGSCTSLTLTLPVAALSNGFLVGGENQSTGKMAKLPLNAGSTTTGFVTYYDNTQAYANSTLYIFPGVYQSN